MKKSNSLLLTVFMPLLLNGCQLTSPLEQYQINCANYGHQYGSPAFAKCVQAQALQKEKLLAKKKQRRLNASSSTTTQAIIINPTSSKTPTSLARSNHATDLTVHRQQQQAAQDAYQRQTAAREAQTRANTLFAQQQASNTARAQAEAEKQARDAQIKADEAFAQQLQQQEYDKVS